MSAHPADVVRFGADGLVPAVAQDAVTGDVLMLAFMNAEALRLTQETGRAHYWSRSRGKLWRKGESSGNEQIVDAIFVNCEQNSILLQVRQVGAVCHDGYPTCYYRRLAPDQSLTTEREQVFDPSVVYGTPASVDDRVAVPATDPLAEATRLQFRAYAWLRDHDLSAESATSRRLREPGIDVRPRIADELGELAGVLTGEHCHADRASDLRLEASQVIYWVLLAALRDGAIWARLRPDRALAVTDESVSPGTVALLLRADAARWREAGRSVGDLAARCHATLALVGHACVSGGIAPLEPVAADLDELRGRPYLATFFAQQAAGTSPR